MSTPIAIPDPQRPGASLWDRLGVDPPRLPQDTIRTRIYITLVAIIVLTLVIVTLIYNVLIGGYQDQVDQLRVR